MRPDVQWRSCRESELNWPTMSGGSMLVVPPMFLSCEVLPAEPAAQRVSASGGLSRRQIRSARPGSGLETRPAALPYNISALCIYAVLPCFQSVPCLADA